MTFCCCDCAERLNIGNNELTGTIPSEIGSLQALRKYCTLLTDNLRLMFVHLANITLRFAVVTAGQLYLDNNQLTGTIPSEIGSATELCKYCTLLIDSLLPLVFVLCMIDSHLFVVCLLQATMNFENNGLTGIIPVEVCNLSIIYLLKADFDVFDSSVCVPSSLCVGTECCTESNCN